MSQLDMTRTCLQCSNVRAPRFVRNRIKIKDKHVFLPSQKGDGQGAASRYFPNPPAEPDEACLLLFNSGLSSCSTCSTSSARNPARLLRMTTPG